MNTTLNTLLIILLFVFVSWVIYNQIQEHYSKDDPVLRNLLETVRPLFYQDNYYLGSLSSLNNRNILDEITLYKGNKSYTINKEKVYICLKDEKDDYYPKNMLIYVFLHELSHVICDEIGHTDKFHRIFEDLLGKAIEKGIYNPSIPIITDYCQHGDN